MDVVESISFHLNYQNSGHRFLCCFEYLKRENECAAWVKPLLIKTFIDKKHGRDIAVADLDKLRKKICY